MKALFGSAVKTRFFPSFFPFTEPSADVQISCIFCGGKGCRKCKDSGWIELLGCGMVYPPRVFFFSAKPSPPQKKRKKHLCNPNTPTSSVSPFSSKKKQLTNL